MLRAVAMACLAPLFLAGCSTTPSVEAVARGYVVPCGASSLRPEPSDAEVLRRVAQTNTTLKWPSTFTEIWLTGSGDSVVLCRVGGRVGDSGFVSEWWKFAPGSDRVVAQDVTITTVHERRR